MIRENIKNFKRIFHGTNPEGVEYCSLCGYIIQPKSSESGCACWEEGIEDAEKALAEAKKLIADLKGGLEFYSEESNWCFYDKGDPGRILMTGDDFSTDNIPPNCEYIAGKTARETLEKNSEALKRWE